MLDEASNAIPVPERVARLALEACDFAADNEFSSRFDVILLARRTTPDMGAPVMTAPDSVRSR